MQLIEGIEAIKDFIDPKMPMSYFWDKVRPELDDILFERQFRNVKGGNIPKLYTYSNLLQAKMLDLKEIGILGPKKAGQSPPFWVLVPKFPSLSNRAF